MCTFDLLGIRYTEIESRDIIIAYTISKTGLYSYAIHDLNLLNDKLFKQVLLFSFFLNRCIGQSLHNLSECVMILLEYKMF
jgi:hypothetical protein